MVRGLLRTIGIQNYLMRFHLQPLSLYYYDLTRIFFLIVFFSGILSTGWFGVPLVPHYFTDHDITGFRYFIYDFEFSRNYMGNNGLQRIYQICGQYLVSKGFM